MGSPLASLPIAAHREAPTGKVRALWAIVEVLAFYGLWKRFSLASLALLKGAEGERLCSFPRRFSRASASASELSGRKLSRQSSKRKDSASDRESLITFPLLRFSFAEAKAKGLCFRTFLPMEA